MNKEYTRIGDIIYVRDENGNLHKRELSSKIDEVLLNENRLEILDAVLHEEQENLKKLNDFPETYSIEMRKFKRIVTLVSCGVTLLGFSVFKNIFPNIINNNISVVATAITFAAANIIGSITVKERIKEITDRQRVISTLIRIYCNEKDVIESHLKELEKDGTGVCIKNEDSFDVSDDKNYIYELADKVDVAYEYVQKEKILLEQNNKGTLDTYLDSIGCRDEDKSIYKELLGVSSVRENSKPVQKTK